MLFIDGSWLYHVRPYLLNLDGRQDFELDYKALPLLVKNHLQQQLETQVDMVRTYYFGTIAINKPGHDNLREKQFYEMLNSAAFTIQRFMISILRTRRVGGEKIVWKLDLRRWLCFMHSNLAPMI